MRIVFVSYHYSPDISTPQAWVNRIQFYIGWLECLARQHTVIRVDQINYEGNFIHNGVQYHFADDGKKKNYFPKKLNRFVKNLNPDVVVVSSFLFPLQVIQLRHCLGNKVKIIIQHHAEKPFTRIKKYIQRLASRKVSAFLFTAYETGVHWAKKGNIDSEEKIRELMEVSSSFIVTDKIIAKEKTGVSGSPVFLWVGRLNQNKDPLTAIKAFLRFSTLQPDARLYMIYHTDELIAEIKNLLPQKNDLNPVVLVGKIEHHDLLYWFNSADYFISASHYEGSGTALTEAMSCGCMPVVSSIPSFKKICNNFGLFFEPGNEDALFNALQQTMQINAGEKKNEIVQHFNIELSFEAISLKFQQLVASL